MRFRGLLLGDIRFQIKYGFYFLYFFLTVIYTIILYFIPAAGKDKVGAIIIFTDPATLGLFFMGSIILLEKSQRVVSSLAVSPIKIREYIISKVFSLSIISTLVGVMIGIITDIHNLMWMTIGTFLGSVFFSLLGIIIATNANSLNRFLVTTIPAMLFLMLPAIVELFGYENMLFLFLPGNIILRLIEGNSEALFLCMLVMFVWMGLFYILAHQAVSKMLKTIGGVKL